MSKLTLADLRKLRESKQQTLALRETEGKDTQIIVGMGTCGIAAGAKDTFGAVVDAIAARGLTNVMVRQTGCMGLCHSEPTVEVLVPGMPAIIYGNVDADVGRQIVEKHVVAHQLLDGHICDRPAVDIIGKA
jgi:NADP-reducing hydrogenase subunit HndB